MLLPVPPCKWIGDGLQNLPAIPLRLLCQVKQTKLPFGAEDFIPLGIECAQKLQSVGISLASHVSSPLFIFLSASWLRNSINCDGSSRTRKKTLPISPDSLRCPLRLGENARPTPKIFPSWRVPMSADVPPTLPNGSSHGVNASLTSASPK